MAILILPDLIQLLPYSCAKNQINIVTDFCEQVEASCGYLISSLVWFLAMLCFNFPFNM